MGIRLSSFSSPTHLPPSPSDGCSGGLARLWARWLAAGGGALPPGGGARGQRQHCSRDQQCARLTRGRDEARTQRRRRPRAWQGSPAAATKLVLGGSGDSRGRRRSRPAAPTTRDCMWMCSQRHWRSRRLDEPAVVNVPTTSGVTVAEPAHGGARARWISRAATLAPAAKLPPGELAQGERREGRRKGGPSRSHREWGAPGERGVRFAVGEKSCVLGWERIGERN
jgi:hypothetical protein